MTESPLFSFTQRFALPKTLRFELVPVGETLTHLKNANQAYYDEEKKKDADLQLVNFLHDQQIENAYQTLKPVFDKIHEEFITKSLENDEAKKIDFSKYFELKNELVKLKNAKSNANKDKKKEIEKRINEIDKEGKSKGELQKLEDGLRKIFEDLYKIAGEDLKGRIKGVDLNEDEENNKEETENIEVKEDNKKGFRKLLTAKILLEYIKNNIDNYITIKSKEELEDALMRFKGFSGYFGGFDLNRLNYYEIKKESSTAIATRIVNENLPKFVDNIFLFEKQKDEYNKIFQELKNTNNKDKEGKEKEVKQFWSEIFAIKKDNDNNVPLSQKQIDEYNEKIGDNNYLINLYNQLNQHEKDFKKLSQFKILFKQIGCGEKKEFITLIKDEKNLKETLKKVKEAGEKYFNGESREIEEKHTIGDFIRLLEDRKDYKGIYWSKQAINTISGKYFANWHELAEKLQQSKVFQKADNNADEQIKIPEAIELSELFDVLDKNAGEEWKGKGAFFKLSLIEGSDKDRNEKIINHSIQPSQALLKMILADLEHSAKRFIENNEVIENGQVKIIDFDKDSEKAKIKLWIDETLTVNRILKYFITKENKRKGNPQDSEVENLLKSLIYEFDWFKHYDAVRNYLTKKQQNEINKLKLNFKNAALASGWDINKETDNFCVVLQDEAKNNYLAILRNENKTLFEKILVEGRGKNQKITENELYISNNSGRKKMNYKQIAAPTGIGGFVRKCFNTAQQYGWKCPASCLNDDGKIIIKNEEAVNNLKEIIDCYKDFFDKYEKDGFKYKDYDFVFKPSEEYTTLNDFFNEVEQQGYKVDFTPINKQKLDSLVKAGQFYLFKINCNKKKIQRNYWKETIKEKSSMQLNGGAEVFFRPAGLEKKVKKGYENKKWVIENKRFTEGKFLFHCPIKINYKSKSYSKPQYAISEVNTNLKTELMKPENSNQVCFLGIDRGEKHLAYYSLVNQKGEILKQGSLNLPFLDKDGKPRSIKAEKYFEADKPIDEKSEWKPRIVDCWNYNDLLDARASNRDMARKNWRTIGTIKELKDGYISQVVHEIVNLIIYEDVKTKELRKVPALVVLENLNSGFKNSRKKIEKQVYQKLELALAKKLNFVVDKTAKDGELLSVQNALQLTPPVDNFSDIEKAQQYGIMLYTRANYTSQTDPKTGRRKTIYLKRGRENIKAQICEKFDEFGFDGTDYYFKYKVINTGKTWTLYSGKDGKSLDRFRRKLDNDTNIWKTKRVDVVSILDGIFEKYGKSEAFKFIIDKKNGMINNEQGQKIELTKITDKDINKDGHTAWESLMFAIDLIQQIRNSGPKNTDGAPTKDDDFILSPVRDGDGITGNHFDSREFLDASPCLDGHNPKMPTSGDANGAFNIARKGLMMLKRIAENPEKPNLFISDEEWDERLSEHSE